MAKAVALFEGGITERRQAAVREDGVVFRRAQVRDPRYGYRWSAWRPAGQRLSHNEMHGLDELGAGFSSLIRVRNNEAWIKPGGEVRVRLP